MTLIQEKVAQAMGILRELDIPCWITFVRESAITGDPTLPFLAPAHLTWHSAFILTSTGDARAIVGQYDAKMIEDTGAYRSVEGYVQGIREPLLRTLRALDPASVALNFSKDSEVCDGLTHGMYLTIADILAEAGMRDRIVSAEHVVSALRARKTPAELGRLKKAIAATEDIFRKAGAFIAPGRSERDVAEFVRREVAAAALGYAWDESTCPAVFSGPDTAGAHYTPTGRAIERGHVVNMDFGVKVEDYCADLQRTWYVPHEDGTVPDAVQRGFDTIVAAIEAGRRALRPGVQGRTVDAAARKVIVDAGYEEFPHALGHQVGRFAHDGTAGLAPAWEKYGSKPFIPIEEGMVFTLEPRLTVPGHGIATVEEMVIVTRDGAEFLSTPQRKLGVIAV